MVFLSGVFTGVLLTILILGMAWAIITRDEQDLERE